MRTLLDQIDGASRSQFFFLALYGALTVPDVAGSLAHPSGEASPQRYVDWVQANLSSWSNLKSAKALYGYRCRILHQNTGHPDSRSGGSRLIFGEPDPRRPALHDITISTQLTSNKDDPSADVIDVPTFCTEMTSAARAWLARNRSDATVKANLQKSIERHPNGIPPFIVGFPVIG